MRLIPLIGQIMLLTTASSAADVTVFVGTYTNAQSKGVYTLQFDEASGKLSAPALAAESESPSFLAMHPTGRYLYAANEHPSGPAKALLRHAADAQLVVVGTRGRNAVVGHFSDRRA